jgi:hypothetical protein
VKAEGFEPAVVVEISPNNFQAWLNHGQVLYASASTQVAKQLAERFGGDLSSADWRHFGPPGFTSPKPAAISNRNRARILESGRDTVGRLRYLEQPLTRGESHHEGGHA